MTIEHSITVHPSNENFKQVSHEKNGRFSRYGFFLSITSLLNQINETRRPVTPPEKKADQFLYEENGRWL
jgi:hypothetical protein